MKCCPERWEGRCILFDGHLAAEYRRSGSFIMRCKFHISIGEAKQSGVEKLVLYEFLKSSSPLSEGTISVRDFWLVADEVQFEAGQPR